MADVAPAQTMSFAARGGGWLSAMARQRELSLVAVMLVLGAMVTLTAPQFLTISNLSQVAALASITAVAAIGEGLVIITRNVDLSVEAMMGFVAYSVASILERHALDAGPAIAFGLGLGLVLGTINGLIVTRLKVPAIVATLGTLSIFRGVDYLVAGSHQVPLAGLPEGFTNPARDAVFGIPIFVIVTVVVVVIVSVALRSTRFGRQLYAVGSNPEAADVLGIPSRLVVFVAFAACGLLAGVAGVMFVMEFGTINGTSATGLSLAVVAAVVVGGVNIFGGTGSVVGAMLGALFLGFIANALILVGLSQFWLQAIYGAVILVAVSADAVIVRRLKRANSRNAAR
ncbi:MAG: ABC transporter permease [Aeromicrobium sp.]